MRRLRVMLCAFNVHGYHSLALGYLKAYALKDEFLRTSVDIEIVDFSTEAAAPRQVLYYLSRMAPDIVGFSCYCWGMNQIVEICAQLKYILPRATIVLGGPEAGPIAEAWLARLPAVDAVVRGEGEATFADLLGALSRKRGLREVAGLVFREGNQLFATAPRPLIADLNEIPSPYLSGVLPPREGVTYLETFRGCPFRCAYCYEGKNFPKLRYFDPERTRAEVEWLASSGAVHRFSFVDSVFNLRPGKTAELAEIIATAGRGQCRLHTIEVVAETITEKTIAAFKQAGIDSVEMGPQTVNPGTLKNVHRFHNPERFAKALRLLRQAGIRTLCDLIVGLPGDDFFKVLHSGRTVFALQPDRVVFSILHVLPGTYLWEHGGEKFGLTFDPKPPHIAIGCRSFPFEELVRAEIMCKALDKEYNLYIK
jgi:radical SAM superfamily enzyme YgiQ (UPF0313 family)